MADELVKTIGGVTYRAMVITSADASGGGGGAATIADGADIAEGTTTDIAYTDATGAAAGTLVKVVKGLFVKLSNALVVSGNVASGATDSGAPVKSGGIYNSTLPTFTTGQRGDTQIDSRGGTWVSLKAANGTAGGNIITPTASANTLTGGLVVNSQNLVYNGTNADFARGDVNGSVVQLAMTGSRWLYAAASGGISNSTTAVTIAAAAGGTLRNYITGIQIFSDALGAATEIAVRDGAAGTVLWRGKIGTAGITGGEAIVFPVPLKGTANTLMEVVTLTASVTGAVYFNAQGFTAT